MISGKLGGKKMNHLTMRRVRQEHGGNESSLLSVLCLPATLPLLVSSCKSVASGRQLRLSVPATVHPRKVPNRPHSAAPHGVAPLCTTRMDTTGVPPRCQATMFILRHFSPRETADRTGRLTARVHGTAVHLQELPCTVHAGQRGLQA